MSEVHIGHLQGFNTYIVKNKIEPIIIILFCYIAGLRSYCTIYLFPKTLYTTPFVFHGGIVWETWLK